MPDPDEVTAEAVDEQADDFEIPDTPRNFESGFECHECGRELSRNHTRDSRGRYEHTAVCPNCRDRGTLTVVEIDGYGTVREAKKLARRQRIAFLQTQSVAAFIDAALPAGHYRIRRVAPHRVVVDWSHVDGFDDDARDRLLARLRAVDAWDVRSPNADCAVLSDADFATNGDPSSLIDFADDGP